MEQWDPLHQSRSDGGELVTDRYGPNFAKLPLLPYERTLIHSLGMTEDEYYQYLQWIQRKNTAKILENQITADAIIVPTLISLAVGVLFTAAGALLAPKPKAPNTTKQKQITNKQGENEKGRQRYSPTYGFDTLTDLASYGTAIPIHYGKYTNFDARRKALNRLPIERLTWMCSEHIRYIESETNCGGIVVSPLLVWSRLYSMGKGQIFQGQYVVGDQLEKESEPDLKGIWIGNNTLDHLSKDDFAFYYDTEGKTRLNTKSKLYGDQKETSSGNPFLGKGKYKEGKKEPFPAPVCDQEDASGFCMTYTLQNQSQFGCFAPIMNGSDRRPPWRVISVPDSLEDQARETPEEERLKISGNKNVMKGCGLGYGRKMGLTKWGTSKNNLQSISKEKKDPQKRKRVQKGEYVRFEIAKEAYQKDTFNNDVSVEDLTNESDAERQAADDALQLGEEFMIHASRFRVVDRSEKPYEIGKKGIDAVLECLESRHGSREIGFVPVDYIEDNICSDDGEEFTSIFDKQHVPSDWDPLLKYSIGSFRNIRRPDVTEIGIKSRVWGQMNGMCNFPTIPTDEELQWMDESDTSFQNGVQSQYFTRYSLFEVHVRKTNKKNSEDPDSWTRIDAIFAVKGSTPVDQYNYLRFKPKNIDRYEYRFYPLTGSFAAGASESPKRWTEDDVAWVLDVTRGDEFVFRRDVKGVTDFEIRSTGYLVSISCITVSPLMLGKGRGKKHYVGTEWCPPPYCVGKNGRFDDDAGDPDDYAPNIDKYLNDTCDENESGCGGSEALAVNESTDEIPEYIRDGFGGNCVTCGDTYESPVLRHSDEKDGKSYDCTWNIWERCTQTNEGSHYSGLISRSCDSGPEHEIVYVNESAKTDPVVEFENMTMMGLSLRAGRQFTALDQPRLWLAGGIEVRLLENETLSPEYNHRGIPTQKSLPEADDAIEATLSTRARPSTLDSDIYRAEVECDSNEKRIITVKAKISDSQPGSSDPRDVSHDINWMVQWFKGKTRDHNARIKDPDWVGTDIKADWRSRNPHATLIKGNEAKIRVPKGYGWVTCYMWPGESDTTNNDNVEDESGLNFGPESNNDLKRSLSGFKFDDEDKIVSIFANGVKKILNQNTSGTGNNAKYTVNYEYLWSGKQNLSQEDRNSGEYIYWYELNDARAQIQVTDDLCPEDPRPPGPLPFSAKIVCGTGELNSTLTCQAQNCSGTQGVSYQWQHTPNSFLGYEDVPGATTSSITAQLLGWYRCEAKCRTEKVYTNGCSITDGSGPIPAPKPDGPTKEIKDSSSNYANLIYHLLTDKERGLGQVIKADMVDKDRMIVTAKFQRQMALTFDGTLSEQVNLRTFAAATAPFFLCNFTVTNGKFTLWPVLPTSSDGKYQGNRLKIKQIFTEGNVIDGSFRTTYLDSDDRRRFKASMRYRICAKNQLPEERVLTTKWYEGKWSDDTEEFDMTQFCTSPEHALLAARYFMWLRNVVTHSISLQTVPEVMNGVGPGDFIKLAMSTVQICRESIASVEEDEASPASPLTINSASTWSDGEHEVNYWQAGMPEPAVRTVTVRDNKVLDLEMRGALMSTTTSADSCGYNACEDIYQVEQVNLGEDGLVDIVATYYPCDQDGIPDLYNALFAKGRYEEKA